MAAVQRPEELHPRVMERVAELTAIVRQRMPAFLQPTVGYYEGRAAAGLAYYRTHRIEFHRTLLRENVEEFLREVVAHEMAHVTCYALAAQRRIPGNGRGHGRHWQGVMRVWFGIEPRRTHNYDMQNAGAKRQHRWRAECGCADGCVVTTARRNKMLRGVGYRCRKCAQTLAFPEERIA